MAKLKKFKNGWVRVVARKHDGEDVFFKLDQDFVTVCGEAFDRPNVEEGMVIMRPDQWELMSHAIGINLINRKLLEGTFNDEQRNAALLILTSFSTKELRAVSTDLGIPAGALLNPHLVVDPCKP